MTTQPNQGQPPAAVNPLRDVNIVGGSIASSTTAKSTAAAPTYVEGADSPISQDLAGNLRISGSFSASFAEATFNTSASVTSATTIVTKANTVGYYSAFVQIEGIGTSTVVCEVNNSGTWVVATVESVTTPGPLSAITTNGIYRVPTGALGFRVRVSVYDGSATVACNLWMRAFPISTPVGGVPVTNVGTFAVQAAQSGTWTVGISAAQTIATTNAGTFAVQAAQSGAWNIGNITGTVSLPTGAATSALQTTVNTTLGSPFQAGGSIGNTSFGATQATAANLNATVVGTGTFACQATQAGTWNIGTVTTLTGITPAFGATASPVPVSAGYQGYRGTTANPTAVTDGQMVGATADKIGRVVSVIGHVRALTATTPVLVLTATTTETSLIAAGGAGVFNDIYWIKFTNTSATGTEVELRDVSAGTVIDSFYVPPTDTRGITVPVPYIQTTANSAWTVKCITSISSLKVSAGYVKNT